MALKDVVFVLDTSGFMPGKKIAQAKKALEFCVENLNDGDHFELVRFSTEVEPLFDKLADATPANRSKAEDFIKDLKATAPPPLTTPCAGPSPCARWTRPPFVIIFLIDGMPTIASRMSCKSWPTSSKTRRNAHAHMRRPMCHANAQPEPPARNLVHACSFPRNHLLYFA